MKQSEFIKKSSIEPSLIKAVVRGLGGWTQFKVTSLDVVNHGAAGGYGDFIFYSGTIAFAYKNRDAILKLLTDLNESIGETTSVISLVQTFGCLKSQDIGADEIGLALYGPKKAAIEQTQVMNALAWLALEEVCRAYMDVLEGV
jgi:hypothetical protein